MDLNFNVGFQLGKLQSYIQIIMIDIDASKWQEGALSVDTNKNKVSSRVVKLGSLKIPYK